MNFHFSQAKYAVSIALLGVFLFLPASATAQRRFSKTYAANKNVRLQLTNRTGTVTVSGWNRGEVRVTANLEAPIAKIIPESSGNNLIINVVRDNYGRGDVGSVNFEIRVPFGSTVDIETKMGNLTVRDISGEMVRASVTSEGDITLSGINTPSVIAANVTGDIFFDGELHNNGIYKFSTTRGNINVQIPFQSSFRMVATAPSTNSINVGAFNNNGLNFAGTGGRRMVGSVNGGNSSLTLTSQRGSISFIKK